jgi:putative ABC transport system permease protein
MGMWSRIGKTFRGDRHSAEIQEELQFHLDMDAAEIQNRREAHLRLGNMARIEEETRSMGIIEWLDSALQDARYGLRQLRKTPALALAVVLSLTVGVGANTAIFSLVDAAILKPLPVNNPDSLRIVEWTSDEFPAGVYNINGDFNRISGSRVQASSIGSILYRNLAREQTSFAALMGIADPNSAAIAVDASSSEQVSLQYVSANFFQGLGVLPVAGRPFRDEEDRVGQEPVAIVSHRFWMRHLGGGYDTINDTIDRKIRVNNVPARIVGVAPAGFFGLRAGQWTDVYAPLAARVAFQPDRSGGALRGEDDRDWWVRQVARMKPDVQETVARTQIAALFRHLAVPEGKKVEPQKIPELITLPGRRGFNALSPRDTSALWILMLLVGVLMLIVCANVANLLLSRSVGRQRESAVRLALGAARLRLFRQHLIESGVFALLGGAAGLALGYVLARSVHLLFQSGRDASSAFDLQLNLRVLGYTGALSILTALLFGLAPAVKGARADLGDALKAQTRSVLGGRLRLPRLLVSIQIALCLTALVAAGLLSRSLANLKWTEVGFDRENLAYASVSPGRAGYSVDRLGPYADHVREALSRLPGVLQVSTVQARLLSGNGNVSRVNISGRSSRIERGIVNEADAIQRNAVGDGFFETLRIPLIAGRRIDRRDIHPKADAVVVDELFTQRFFPNQNPVGLRFGLDPKDNNRYEIVGVVGNVRYMSLRNDAFPTVYESYIPGGTIHFAIRTAMDSARLTEAVRKAVAAVDPAVPLSEFHTQTGLIDRMLRTERLLSFMSGAFGLVALTLAAIGLGGLLAYAVARRTNEIGVRMALGAGASDVMRMVWRDSFWMVGTGTLMGIPCAYVIGKVLKSALFRLEPLDPWTATISLVALLAVAVLAAWIPARRAARIDPMIALREE